MNPGIIVETQKSKKGRTYNSKGLINDKVPVYLFEENVITGKTSATGVLCRPDTLRILGYID